MAEKVNLVEVHNAGGYGSEFEYDSELERRREKRQDLIPKKTYTTKGVPSKCEVTQEYNKEEGRTHRFHFLSLDAFSRHKKMINDYFFYYSGNRTDFKRDTSKDKTDLDVIRENHRFLWNEGDEPEDTWEKRLAKKYYDKLFKEYCIADLSRYKENKIALRWRIEKEVVSGKGQFICGNKKCEERDALRSWEVNFGYVEHNEKKNALVKLRLCPDCSYRLNYHHKKREIKAKRKQKEVTNMSKKQKTTHHTEDNSEPGSSAVTMVTVSKTGSQSPSETAGEDGAAQNIWSGPVKLTEDKSREEEFDDYFEDMFL